MAAEERFPCTLVDSPEALRDAVASLGRHREVAFDAEGRNLSRAGALTVACFLGVAASPREGDPPPPAFVVDVQALGGRAAFGSGLGDLLERRETTKLTFDCRGDSDALFHQFGVRLDGVLDTQVLDQACRIAAGEAPPARRGAWVPFVRGMSRVAESYIDAGTRRELGHHLPAPHKGDEDVWVRRPLSANAVRYAAADVHTIALMAAAMRDRVTPALRGRAELHSQRYTAAFREREAAPEWPADKAVILEEHSILEEPRFT